MGSYSLMSIEFQFYKIKRAMEKKDGGDACTL